MLMIMTYMCLYIYIINNDINICIILEVGTVAKELLPPKTSEGSQQSLCHLRVAARLVYPHLRIRAQLEARSLTVHSF